MGTVLFIKGTPQDEHESRSLYVARKFMDAYRERKPEDEIIEIDVYQKEIPLIDQDVLHGWGKLREGKALTPEEERKIQLIDANTEQFMNADKYIIVSPLWNLGVPPMLKAYFDNVAIAGKTFHYTEHGPVGDLENKLAIHFHGAGGVYSDGQHTEHGDSYIRHLLGFLGIEALPTVWVEGIDYAPDKKEIIIKRAIERAKLELNDFIR